MAFWLGCGKCSDWVIKFRISYHFIRLISHVHVIPAFHHLSWHQAKFSKYAMLANLQWTHQSPGRMHRATADEKAAISSANLINLLQFSYFHPEWIYLRKYWRTISFECNIRMHDPGSRRFGATTAGPLQLDGESPLRLSQPEHGSTRAEGKNGGRSERRHTQPWAVCYAWHIFCLTSLPVHTSGPWSRCKVIIRQQKAKEEEIKRWKKIAKTRRVETKQLLLRSAVISDLKNDANILWNI